MRIIPTLMRNAREPQNVKKVPFEEMLPLQLRDFVSGKNTHETNVACIQEMAILFACLKDNEFSQQACEKQIGNFKTCYKDFIDAAYAKKMARREGKLTTGKKLHARELNVYLKNYPNPK